VKKKFSHIHHSYYKVKLRLGRYCWNLFNSITCIISVLSKHICSCLQNCSFCLLVLFPYFCGVCKKLTCCCVAAMCPGHGFPARHVIHVNSPTWKSQNAVQQLETAVVNILKLADEKQLRVLAVPSISSGQSVSHNTHPPYYTFCLWHSIR